jgi:hypothetical protein
MCNRGFETFDKAGRVYVRKYEGILVTRWKNFKAGVATVMETVNSNLKTEKLN